MPSNNIVMLQTVADGLGEMKNEMVFVGGAVAELYAGNAAVSDIRPTLDVDCLIELSSRTAHAKLENDLRTKGFANDTTPGAPTCRWVFKGIKLDVMPTDSGVLGFTNIWYKDGIQYKILKILPDGTEVFVFQPGYYLATKFEAHQGRGGNDLRQSHDFEDIIYIFDNCPDLLDHIENADSRVKIYLKEKCRILLENKNLTEGIESALPYGTGPEGTDIIMDLIQRIADIE
jgi:hypothetical protein